MTQGGWPWWFGSIPPHVPHIGRVSGAHSTPHNTHKIDKVETRCPSTHNWNADLLESFVQVKHQCDRSWVFFACTEVESFHLKHGCRTQFAPFLHSARQWRPPLLPSRCFHGPLRKTSLCKLAAAICHTVLLFQRVPQLLFSVLLTNPTELWVEIHHIPHPSLPCNSSLPSPHLLPSTSGALPSNYSAPPSSTACPSDLAQPCCTATACPIPAFFFFALVEKSDVFLFFFQHSHSSHPSSGLRDFVQQACSSFCTDDHTAEQLVVFFLLPLFLILLLLHLM